MSSSSNDEAIVAVLLIGSSTSDRFYKGSFKGYYTIRVCLGFRVDWLPNGAPNLKTGCFYGLSALGLYP